jgi:hypothetical protein
MKLLFAVLISRDRLTRNVGVAKTTRVSIIPKIYSMGAVDEISFYIVYTNFSKISTFKGAIRKF